MFKLIPIALMCIGAVLAFAEPGAADRGEASYQVGMKALDAKQWQNAIEQFDGVPPDNARADGALYWKAYALNKLGRPDDALASLDRAITGNPDLAKAHQARASILKAMGRADEAQASLEQAAAIEAKARAGGEPATE